MKNCFVPVIIVASALAMSVLVARPGVQGQNNSSQTTDKTGAITGDGFEVNTSGQAGSPIYGVTIPAGYRDWKVIAVNQLLLAGRGDQLRAQLGNDIAIKAFKEGMVPFPDGAIIAAIHWTRVASEDNNQILDGPFPGTQSFVIGSPVNVQFMVKDSKKYAATGGWGFADFKDGKPGSKALHETCFACHEPAKDRDFVFARYAPAP